VVRIVGLRNYFKDKSTQWTIGTQGVNLALVTSPDSDPASNVLEALQALENLLCVKKQRAFLFLDEVQEIGEIDEGKSIEGAIRHVAQKTKYLSLVFSGSNRKLLARMFYDRSRPLYKLCDRIALERISKEEYVKHINNIARSTWGKDMDASTLDKIFELTELHPYYINNLCLRAWETSIKKSPTSEDMLKCWNEIIKENRSETLKELSMLSMSQRKVIAIIAKGTKNALSGKKTLKQLDLSSSSVIEALQALEQKDYIEQFENNDYGIIDPLIKATLLFYYK